MQRRGLSRLALLLATALALVAAAGCSPAKQASFQLDYRVQGGIAGFDTLFAINDSGKYTLSERGRIQAEGSLAAAEVASLRLSLAKVPWDNIQKSYDAASGVRDDLTYIISYTEAGKVRQVSVAGTAQSPQEVRDLIAFLEALRQAHRAAAPNAGAPAPNAGTGSAPPPQPGPTATGPQDSRDGFVAYASGPEKALYWQAPGGAPRRLIRLQDLPESFTPQGATPDIRFGVAADHFTAIAVAPGGGRVAFSTMGVHGFVAVVDAPSGSNTGGHLFPLDIGFETGYRQVLWSPDGRYLSVLATLPSGAEGALVYDVTAGTRLDSGWPELTRLLPRPDYSVAPVGWESATTLRLRVAGGPSGNLNTAQLGDWILDVSHGTLTHVGGSG